MLDFGKKLSEQERKTGELTGWILVIAIGVMLYVGLSGKFDIKARYRQYSIQLLEEELKRLSPTSAEYQDCLIGIRLLKGGTPTENLPPYCKQVLSRYII